MAKKTLAIYVTLGTAAASLSSLLTAAGYDGYQNGFIIQDCLLKNTDASIAMTVSSLNSATVGHKLAATEKVLFSELNTDEIYVSSASGTPKLAILANVKAFS